MQHKNHSCAYYLSVVIVACMMLGGYALAAMPTYVCIDNTYASSTAPRVDLHPQGSSHMKWSKNKDSLNLTYLSPSVPYVLGPNRAHVNPKGY